MTAVPSVAPSLPPGFQLRRATAADAWTLRRLVLSAWLDPTQLRWQQFWLVEAEGTIIACGQLRQFVDAEELGSLVVAKSWRDRGIGTALSYHLIQQATKPLYLECVGQGLVQFYSRLGFVSVRWQDLPRSLKAKFALSAIARSMVKFPVTLMHYPGIDAGDKKIPTQP